MKYILFKTICLYLIATQYLVASEIQIREIAYMRSGDRVVFVSTGNPYYDGVGDMAANAMAILSLEKNVKKIRGARLFLLISPESEDFYQERLRMAPQGAQNSNYEINKYNVVYDFFGLKHNEKYGTIFMPNGATINWINEDYAKSQSLRADLGVVVSLFPESEKRLSKMTKSFLERIELLASEWIVANDYLSYKFNSNFNAIVPTSSRLYSPEFYNSVSLSTGIDGDKYYFLDPESIPFSQKSTIVHNYNVLVDANFSSTSNPDIEDFLKFSLEQSVKAKKNLVINFLSKGAEKIIEDTIHKLKSKYFVDEEKLQYEIRLFNNGQKIPFFEFMNKINDFSVIYSGGLTLGSISLSRGIPTFFQKREFLVDSVNRYKLIAYNALKGTSNYNTVDDTLLSNAILEAKIKKIDIVKKMKNAFKDKNVFESIGEITELTLNDSRKIPLSFKVFSKIEKDEDILNFLKSMNCL